MSAWRKVFLRNGLIWTAYLSIWLIADGLLKQPGWPFGFSQMTDQVLTLSVLFPAWIVMCGGAICLFRLVAHKMIVEANRRRLPIRFSAPRWFISYFLEIDQENQLRP
jgi:hypothetical protein